jgi:hypothetical protein
MVSATSNATHTVPVAQSTGTPTQKATQPRPQSTTSGDSAQLSAVAQASLAALKEATETSAQTTKEAGLGDRQAQRLLAKEAATKLSAK